MTRLLKASAVGTLSRHGGLALTGGMAGATAEWAGMPHEAAGPLVVLIVVMGVTVLFFRPKQ